MIKNIQICIKLPKSGPLRSTPWFVMKNWLNNLDLGKLIAEQMSMFISSLIARSMGPIWAPSGADGTHVGPMLAPWTLLSRFCRWTGTLIKLTQYHSCWRFDSWRHQVINIQLPSWLTNAWFPRGGKISPNCVFPILTNDSKGKCILFIYHDMISARWALYLGKYHGYKQTKTVIEVDLVTQL